MQFYTRWLRIASKEIADPVNKIRLIHIDRTTNPEISTILSTLTHKAINSYEILDTNKKLFEITPSYLKKSDITR